jgi:hypothetical protein
MRSRLASGRTQPTVNPSSRTVRVALEPALTQIGEPARPRVPGPQHLCGDGALAVDEVVVSRKIVAARAVERAGAKMTRVGVR